MIFCNKWLILQIISILTMLLLLFGVLNYGINSIFIYLCMPLLSFTAYKYKIEKHQISDKKLKRMFMLQYFLLSICLTIPLLFNLQINNWTKIIIPDYIYIITYIIIGINILIIFTLESQIKKML